MPDDPKPPASHPTVHARRLVPRLARLVVGYDGSPAADAAARFAFELADPSGAEIVLLHAGPAPETAPSADLLPQATEEIVAYEREWCARLHDVGRPAVATVQLERGNPADALIAATLTEEADLLLVGSKGVGRLRGALLGSVSSQLLSHAPCPVMVFRENAAAHGGRPGAVLVGVDGSPDTAPAVRIGQALAIALGARLVLVHAYDPQVPHVSRPPGPLRELLRRHGRAVLDDARSLATAPFDTLLVEGDSRAALSEACEARAPAVLVVGSRGLGGFKELLLGSTARWLAGRAPCPVVVARPPVQDG